jgi:hypothetical protein
VDIQEQQSPAEHSSRRGSSSSNQALTQQQHGAQPRSSTSGSSSRRASNAEGPAAAALPIAPGVEDAQEQEAGAWEQAEEQQAGGTWQEGDPEAASPAFIQPQGSQGDILGGGSGEAEDPQASTPAAVLRGPRGPACSDQEVLDTAQQLTTPMLANSSCAVVELSAAWRTEAAQTQEGWQSLLQEWEAEGGSVSGTPSAAGGAVTAVTAAAGGDVGAGTKQQQPQAAAEAESPDIPATAAPLEAGAASPLQACAVSPGESGSDAPC